MQNPVHGASRSRGGGGLLGFPVPHGIENQTNETDEVLEFDGLKVAVDK